MNDFNACLSGVTEKDTVHSNKLDVSLFPPPAGLPLRIKRLKATQINSYLDCLIFFNLTRAMLCIK